MKWVLPVTITACGLAPVRVGRGDAMRQAEVTEDQETPIFDELAAEVGWELVDANAGPEARDG